MIKSPYKVVSLFSGIGAYEKALKKLNISHEVIRYCEIDEPTAEAYSYIHNVSTDSNLKDVTQMDTSSIPDFDILTYSPPCQTFSVSGKMLGFEDKRGVLFFDALRLIQEKKPKYCIMENVKNLAMKKFQSEFQEMLNSLEEAGYDNFHTIMNSKKYNVPQNRDRVFVVSIRKDLNQEFSFPTEIDSPLRLIDFLEDEVDSKYHTEEYNQKLLSQLENLEIDNSTSKIIKYEIPQIVTVRKYPVDVEKLKTVLRSHKNITIKQIAQTLNKSLTHVEHWFRTDSSFSIPNADVWFELKELLSIETDEFDLPITTFIKKEGVFEKANRVYDVRGIAPTLTKVSAAERILHNGTIRHLTSLECFRLMGFEDEDYYKIHNHFNESKIYGMAGNSVVVNVVEHIFRSLLLKETE